MTEVMSKLCRLVGEVQDCGCDVTDVVEMNYVENDVLIDHLIANGVTIPVRCENCTHHDTDSCPDNRVWCSMIRRYMKPDGYCSYGERREEE